MKDCTGLVNKGTSAGMTVTAGTRGRGAMTASTTTVATIGAMRGTPPVRGGTGRAPGPPCETDTGIEERTWREKRERSSCKYYCLGSVSCVQL